MSYENPWQYNGTVFDSDDIGEYFTVLPISPTNDSTLVESIFGRSENLLERKEK